jgi:hypothetical protein
MTQLGTIAFANLYSSLADARAQVRVGQNVIERALTAGITLDKQGGELGTFEQAQMTVRLLASDELPRNPLTNGKRIDIKVGDQDWQPVRIMGRKNVAGVLTLMIQTPYEQ